MSSSATYANGSLRLEHKSPTYTSLVRAASRGANGSQLLVHCLVKGGIHAPRHPAGHADGCSDKQVGWLCSERSQLLTALI